MRTCLPLFVMALAAASAVGQNKSLIFTGRFPFKSLDAPNERPNGSINQLDEFDFSFVTPGPGAFARSLQPATAHQAYLGDGNADGNFTKFAGFKTYFQNIQFGGLFVKHADKASARYDKVYFTVRSNAAPLQIEAFVNNGTAVTVLRPGDFVRFTGNGNLEFFVTADQLDVAAGPPPVGQTSIKGASAMCQDAAGNLYYSPPQGGHWINGNGSPLVPVFCNDGSIVTIDAANITYDGQGNVAAFAPNSARVLIEETQGGPSLSPLFTRQMVINSLCMDRTGVPLTAAGFGRVAGLDIDPNGGTFAARWPDSTGAFPLEPNLVWTGDPGAWAGTIFSTAGNGSVATINGVLCGSLTLGVPADGHWLGVQLDIANFQPTLMGLCVVDAIAYEPFVLDMPAFGAVQPAGVQPTIDIDTHGFPVGVGLVFADIVGTPFPPSVPSSFVPIPQSFGSHQQAFPIIAPIEVGLVITDANGYASISIGNPNMGALTGLPVVLQGALGDVFTGVFTISNPVLMQFK